MYFSICVLYTQLLEPWNKVFFYGRDIKQAWQNRKMRAALISQLTFQNLTFSETIVFYKDLQGKYFVPHVPCC